jgi:hypothetical protein
VAVAEREVGIVVGLEDLGFSRFLALLGAAETTASPAKAKKGARRA